MSINMDLHCRACLSKCPRSVSIFSSPKLWGKNIAIAKLIMACAPIRIIKDDGFPAKICEDCLKLLQLSFLFRLRVVASEEKMRAALKAKAGENIPKPLLLTAEWGGLDQVYSLDHIRRSAVSEINYIDEEIITIPSDPPKTQNNIDLSQMLNPQTAEVLNNIPVTNEIIESAQIISSDPNGAMIPLQPDSNSNASAVSNIIFINEQNQQLSTGTSAILESSSTNVFQAYEIIPLENAENTDGITLQNLLSTEIPNNTFPTVPLPSFDKITPVDNIQVLKPMVADNVHSMSPQNDAMGTALQLQIENIVGSYIEPYKKIRQKINTNPINIDLTVDEDAVSSESSDESNPAKDESNNGSTIEDIIIPMKAGVSSSRLSSAGDNDDEENEPVKKKIKRRSKIVKKPPFKIDDKLIVIDD